MKYLEKFRKHIVHLIWAQIVQNLLQVPKFIRGAHLAIFFQIPYGATLKGNIFSFSKMAAKMTHDEI